MAAVGVLGPSGARRRTSQVRWVLGAVIAWGALSFGAVYPWAYYALALTCFIAGLLAVRHTRQLSGPPTRSLVAALMAVALAVLCQLLPLPTAVLDWLSPNTMIALRQFDLAAANTLTTQHPVSIFPSATRTAFVLYVAFAALFVGSSRWLSLDGAASTVEIVGFVGAMLALIGIVQKPLFAGRIYGFWTPEMEGVPFGPFLNKNHFAGWMAMAFPLTLGFLCFGIERRMRGAYQDWRERVLWFSSSEANRLILAASAAAVMALSLVLTMSRSGITALAASILLTSILAIRRRTKGSIRATIVVSVAAIAAVVTAWAGADAVVARFSSTDWTEFNNRGGAWEDAASIFQAFPVSGTGLNTYGYATLLYQQHYLQEHFAEAHNDYLQLAAEGGVLLLIPVLVCLLLFVREVRHRFVEDAGNPAYWIRAGAVTALVAIAIQETVDFSLQMPGNAALFAVVCAIAVHRTPSRRTRGLAVKA